MPTSLNLTPIAVLAFANPKGDLDRLIDEQRTIARIFDSMENEGLCAAVEKPAADLDTIISVMQNARFAHRIAIFHFGGHADDYSLLLRDKRIDTKPFDKMLAEISSLRLVFLNGCATRLQAENLQQLGVPAVIASIQAVPDKEASDFANVFYRGLSGGQSIREAFEFAKNSVKSARGGGGATSTRGVGDENDPDIFSWELWTTTIDDEKWTLRDEIDNPYFGLPKPVGYFLPKDPYISLKSYTENECAIFWGRGAEIRDLYVRMLDENANPVTLLYGQTGVGKSSLLDAGLVPRLKVTTNVVYCKRISSEGLSATLFKELALDDQSSSVLADHIKKWSLRSGKKWTVIIIDQIEECFTKPLPQKPLELPDFIKQIFELLQHNVHVKVLLAYRKEFHAEIENGVAAAKLPFSSYFLQALKRSNIKEIVNGSNLSVTSRNQYNIEIEQGLDEQIASDLSADVDSPVAPVLQILLSNLWMDTIPVGNARVFTKETYFKLRKEGIALKDFFNKKVKEIEGSERESVHSGLLLDLLHFHTTVLGTSATHTIQETKDRYDAGNISSLIEKCKSAYLLVDATGANSDVSLAHDTLAPVIRSAFDLSILPGQKASRILNNQVYTDNVPHHLNARDLDLIKKGGNGMRKLNAREKLLLKMSQREVDNNLRRKKYQDIIIRSAVVAVVIALGVSLYLYDRSKNEAKKSRALYLSAEASKMLDSDPTQALHLLRAADSLSPDDDGILEKIYSVYNNMQSNGVYSKHIYTDFEYPALKLSGDKKLMLVINNSSRNDDYTTAYVVDEKEKLSSAIRYKGKQIREIDFIPGKHEIVGVFDSGMKESSLDSIRNNVVVCFDKEGNVLNEHTYKYGIDATCLSNDGETLALVARDMVGDSLQSFIVHQQIRSGREVARFPVTYDVTLLKFHPSRNVILINTPTGIGLLDLSTGRLTSKERGFIGDASFSPDGTVVASYAFDADKISLWRVDDDSERELPFTEVSSIAFSESSDRLMVVSPRFIVVIQLSDGVQLTEIRHDEGIKRAFFSPDDAIAVVSASSGRFTLFDYRGRIIKGLEKNNSIISEEFKNDSVLVTTSKNSIRFWRISDQRKLPEGTWIAKEDHIFNLNDFNLQLKAERNNKNVTTPHFIQDIVPSPVGNVVFSGNRRYEWMQANVSSFGLLDTTVISVIKNGSDITSVKVPGFNVLSALSFGDTGEYLAICNDGKARVINTKGQILAELVATVPSKEKFEDIQYAFVLKSENKILTFTRHGYLTWWDMKFNKLETLDFAVTNKGNISEDFDPIAAGSFAFSERQKLLYVFYSLPYVLVYDMKGKNIDTIYERKRGEELNRNLTGNLINDGKYLITSRQDAIDLWNTATKTKICSLNTRVGSYYLQGNEEALLINQYVGDGIRWLLPKGIKKWIKEVDIAPLSDENKIKYNLK
jgi:WD40 repeat protein